MSRSSKIHRREFVRRASILSSSACLSGWAPRPFQLAAAETLPDVGMTFGLVTYLWGQDWDLPTLITNCEKSGVLGVELRTTHAHGVEPNLNKQQRAEVAQRFADSAVEMVGIGSNEQYDHPDADRLAQAIDATKAFIVLSHDVGGSGVKVKPNSFHENVPHARTIEQIGKSLNELAEFGEGYGQQIRLEVHGQCAELPTIQAIMDVADHPNAAVCWNSNQQDLEGAGLEANFNLVKDRLGLTCHVRELQDKNYPYQELIQLLVDAEYEGWVLLEARGKPADRVAALIEQRGLFAQLVANAVGA